jgi:hypothetical protein
MLLSCICLYVFDELKRPVDSVVNGRVGLVLEMENVSESLFDVTASLAKL